jgi:hypothetical protein
MLENERACVMHMGTGIGGMAEEFRDLDLGDERRHQLPPRRDISGE